MPQLKIINPTKYTLYRRNFFRSTCNEPKIRIKARSSHKIMKSIGEVKKLYGSLKEKNLATIVELKRKGTQ